VVVAAVVQEEEGEVAAEVGGEKSLCCELDLYLVPTRCTLKVSPRGHFTLFFILQYGHSTVRSISFPSPVEPTILIPR
jgi:hypothetical protein